jgi:subtilisin family serine protease
MQSFQLLNQLPAGTQVEDLGLGNWVKIEVPQAAMRSMAMDALRRNSNVLHVQPNYKIKIMENPQLQKLRASLEDDCPIPGLPPELCDILKPPGDNPGNPPGGGQPGKDNPPIPSPVNPGSGNDPLLSSQWGMLDIGAEDAWKKNKGLRDIVVAVIDTGVDYTHEDLKANLWRNPGEIPGNNKDDDGNGYVDDIIGWDFVSNDNKPFDLAVSQFELFQGGNPGHGTHCAGNVAARGFNGKGISGVAPNVQIMSIRFLSEKGQGTTADAVKAVRYAIDNGAHILSNSWGSEGEDTSDGSNEALKDAIRYSEQKGALFIAAAGNGHQGVGYDNDSD